MALRGPIICAKKELTAHEVPFYKSALSKTLIKQRIIDRVDVA